MVGELTLVLCLETGACSYKLLILLNLPSNIVCLFAVFSPLNCLAVSPGVLPAGRDPPRFLRWNIEVF